MTAPNLVRRSLCLAGAALLVAPPTVLAKGRAARHDAPKQEPAIAAIETRIGGRVGVAALDTGSGARIAYRADERFPMCSTFKMLLVAAVLARIQNGEEQDDRTIAYDASALLDYAPIAKAHVHEGGLSVSALCAAAIEYSDNTAANLLLATIGGPSGLTRYVRTLGDATTRLDRNEPALNSALAGDVRDTTTPNAMLGDWNRVLLGNALREDVRKRLQDWLIGNTTGDARIRAGVPSGWHVGDKTGTGVNGATGDVAIVWPAGERKPLLIAVYLHGSAAGADAKNAAIADAARVMAARFA